jgi:hypothetical protein
MPAHHRCDEYFKRGRDDDDGKVNGTPAVSNQDVGRLLGIEVNLQWTSRMTPGSPQVAWTQEMGTSVKVLKTRPRSGGSTDNISYREEPFIRDRCSL